MKEEGYRRGLCGEILVSARVTQLYAEGACVYFYALLDGSGLLNPSETFDEIEGLARKVILEHGGSLSHHHGVGKHRAGFLKEVGGDGVGALARVIKDGLDPDDVFGAKNSWLSERE